MAAATAQVCQFRQTGSMVVISVVVPLKLPRSPGTAWLTSSSVRIGGDRFDASSLITSAPTTVLIGEATAERIKHEIGSAYPGDEVREIEVRP